MKYIIVTDFGGFLWWLTIKFCKTKLEEEQGEKNWARNIIFLITIGILIAFIVIKVF
ncbi:hypothetical protein MW871_15915 [Flavobacterium sp. I-SCBP12n]|uniref:Uncharacterized protein n=1 Tax=Flavobacterium pygoscelis TaxID=2893176 RepID=A0A9X2BMZ1_9FLAO|nr:hypothetical protein [Flavobacterium pygoscelis]MCK8143316.1 hypothetical protein [Flavobacterium pygoscelis]MCK8143378.1 hypothetical protein [Flavobacterium pygoscelis]